jgi:hypothetical protein
MSSTAKKGPVQRRRPWWAPDNEYRPYAVVVVRWAFHSWHDRVTLAVLVLRRGRIAARWVSVREKLPHLDDELVEAVDGIVQYIIERAQKENWCLEDIGDTKDRFGFMFEIEHVDHGYAASGETAEDVAEKVMYFLVEKKNPPQLPTKGLWDAIKKS